MFALTAANLRFFTVTRVIFIAIALVIERRKAPCGGKVRRSRGQKKSVCSGLLRMGHAVFNA
jgi:hypothetical protein|tara:strand:- start:169 stop:354 length:186 start_codon:yes stop_codon:yes gene_type:complete